MVPKDIPTLNGEKKKDVFFFFASCVDRIRMRIKSRHYDDSLSEL